MSRCFESEHEAAHASAPAAAQQLQHDAAKQARIIHVEQRGSLLRIRIAYGTSHGARVGAAGHVKGSTARFVIDEVTATSSFAEIDATVADLGALPMAVIEPAAPRGRRPSRATIERIHDELSTGYIAEIARGAGETLNHQHPILQGDIEPAMEAMYEPPVGWRADHDETTLERDYAEVVEQVDHIAEMIQANNLSMRRLRYFVYAHNATRALASKLLG
jgi:hypothetical protein